MRQGLPVTGMPPNFLGLRDPWAAVGERGLCREAPMRPRIQAQVMTIPAQDPAGETTTGWP